jgi:hypothetical protein
MLKERDGCAKWKRAASRIWSAGATANHRINGAVRQLYRYRRRQQHLDQGQQCNRYDHGQTQWGGWYLLPWIISESQQSTGTNCLYYPPAAIIPLMAVS